MEKRTSPLPLIIFILVILGIVALFGIGIMAPQSLGVLQEQVLRPLHGGIASSTDEFYVDNCVPIDGQIMAVPRVRRTVRYGDGTELVIIFSERPHPSDAQCDASLPGG